jgi:hypothetical protein
LTLCYLYRNNWISHDPTFTTPVGYHMNMV